MASIRPVSTQQPMWPFTNKSSLDTVLLKTFWWLPGIKSHLSIRVSSLCSAAQLCSLGVCSHSCCGRRLAEPSRLEPPLPPSHGLCGPGTGIWKAAMAHLCFLMSEPQKEDSTAERNAGAGVGPWPGAGINWRLLSSRAWGSHQARGLCTVASVQLRLWLASGFQKRASGNRAHCLLPLGLGSQVESLPLHSAGTSHKATQIQGGGARTAGRSVEASLCPGR